MEASRQRPDRARAWFFAFIVPLAILLALGVWQLPRSWQQAVIGFWFVGMPIMVVGLRILHHAADVEIARLANGPERTTTAESPRRGRGQPGDGLRVVEVGTSKGGRVKL